MGMFRCWVVAVLCWSLALPALAKPFAIESVPNPRRTHDGFVSDGAKVLEPTLPELERRLKALHAETGVEVALVTLPSVGEHDVREVATSLFQHWGIGRKGHDDGVLLLHVLDQRRMEIETGYGMESALPDVKCHWLITEVAIPHFRAGDIVAGHEALLRGLDYGIRHPEATHDQLMAASQAAGSDGTRATPAAKVSANADHPLFFGYDGAFGWLSVLLLLGAIFRWIGIRALVRVNPRERPGWELWSFGLLLTAAPLLAAHAVKLPFLLWFSLLGLLGMAGLSAYSGMLRIGEARRLKAPRHCKSCRAVMRAVEHGKQLTHLDPGQACEQRLGSAYFRVWACACGAVHTEREEGQKKLTTCAACSYATEELKSERELIPATYNTKGTNERVHECAHCKAQRSEQLETPKRAGGGYAGGLSSASSRESSRPSRSRSSSSRSSGKSFGGGRSGGGGAGGSY